MCFQLHGNFIKKKIEFLKYISNLDYGNKKILKLSLSIMNNKFRIDIENVEFRQKGSIKPGHGKPPLKFKLNDKEMEERQKESKKKWKEERRKKKEKDWEEECEILDNDDLTYEEKKYFHKKLLSDRDLRKYDSQGNYYASETDSDNNNYYDNDWYYNDYTLSDDKYMVNNSLYCLKYKYRPKIKKEIPPRNRYERYKPGWKPRYMYI